MLKVLSIDVEWLDDPNPDTSYLEQEGFEDRLAGGAAELA